MVSANLEVLIPAIVETCKPMKEIAKEAGVGENVMYRIAKGYLVRMDMMGKVIKCLGLNAKEVIIFDSGGAMR